MRVARLRLYRSRVILRQFPAAGGKPPFRELARFAGGPGGEAAGDRVNSTSSPHVDVRVVGPGPSPWHRAKAGWGTRELWPGSSVAANRIPRRWAAVVPGRTGARGPPGPTAGAGTEADVQNDARTTPRPTSMGPRPPPPRPLPSFPRPAAAAGPGSRPPPLSGPYCRPVSTGLPYSPSPARLFGFPVRRARLRAGRGSYALIPARSPRTAKGPILAGRRKQ